VPAATDWGGTVLAVNVGGAIIPAIMSLYLLFRWQLWLEGLVATVAVAAVCYWFSSPIPGVGIAIPVFVPAIATTIVALMLSRKHAAPLAYIAGSFGTLIGADLLNLNKLADLKAPILSIGGAGTFDGIFVSSWPCSSPVSHGAATAQRKWRPESKCGNAAHRQATDGN
jgi:uncharacterized membrane protein